MPDMMPHAPRATAPADPRRRAMLAKVHIAPKALGMLDDDYRELLHRVTGARSAKDCDDRQLAAVVAEFERLGFRSTAQALPQPQRATHPVARKARALWISLHQLGAVRDGSERALEAFAKRQLGVDRLQWANQSQGYRLIEALKAMAVRHGWAQDVSAKLTVAVQVRLLQERLYAAIVAKLGALGAATSEADDPTRWTDGGLRREITAAARALHAALDAAA